MLNAMKGMASFMLVRYMVGVGLGTMATFLLFMLMHIVLTPKAITNLGAAEPTPPKDDALSWVHLVEIHEPELEQIRLDHRILPDMLPPTRTPEKFEFDHNESHGIFHEETEPEFTSVVNVSLLNPFSEPKRGCLRAPSIYPPHAEALGIEGYVTLEFVVTTTGAVRDPVVIEAEPPGIFDRAAIDAILKYKYKPRVVNGVPTEVIGVRNIITFDLEDN